MSRRHDRELVSGSQDFPGIPNVAAYQQAYLSTFLGDPCIKLTADQMHQRGTAESIDLGNQAAVQAGHHDISETQAVVLIPDPLTRSQKIDKFLDKSVPIVLTGALGVALGLLMYPQLDSPTPDLDSLSDRNFDVPNVVQPPPPKNVKSGSTSTSSLGMMLDFAGRSFEECDNPIEYPGSFPDGVEQTREGNYLITDAVDPGSRVTLYGDNMKIIVTKDVDIWGVVGCGDSVDLIVSDDAQVQGAAVIGRHPHLEVEQDGSILRGYLEGPQAQADIAGAGDYLMVSGRDADVDLSGTLRKGYVDTRYGVAAADDVFDITKEGEIGRQIHYRSSRGE